MPICVYTPMNICHLERNLCLFLDYNIVLIKLKITIITIKNCMDDLMCFVEEEKIKNQIKGEKNKKKTFNQE